MPGAASRRELYVKSPSMQSRCGRPVYRAKQANAPQYWLYFVDDGWSIGLYLGDSRRGVRARVSDDARSPEMIYGKWQALNLENEYQPASAMLVGLPPLPTFRPPAVDGGGGGGSSA